MVIVKIYGGLGNQMFQYAAGLVLASRLKTKLYVDASWFNEKQPDNVTPRQYELDIFGINKSNLMLRKLASITIRKIVTLNEPGFTKYSEEFKAVAGNVKLDGYWQSYKYLEYDKNLVKAAFTFPKNISEQNSDLIKKIETSESVAVHVRRADYVNVKSTSEFHGLATLDYYKEAVAEVTKKIKKPRFFVFSDDQEWCKNNLKFGENVTFVDHNHDKQSFEDMRLMSLCKHNIIANSSFSWWGAWLNSNNNKLVYAPKKWFNEASIDTSELTPPDWSRI